MADESTLVIPSRPDLSVPTMRTTANVEGALSKPPPWARYRVKMATGETLYAMSDGKVWRRPDGTVVSRSPAAQATPAPGAAPWTLDSLTIKGMKFTNPNVPTMAERTRQQKLKDMSDQVLELAENLKSHYISTLAPKLKSGKIGSTSQGLGYLYSSRLPGTELDPDAEYFMTQTGPLSTAANAYYSAQSGGRGGAQQFEKVTMPHVPHPPPGLLDVINGRWSLEKQAGQLDTIINTVHILRGDKAPKTVKALGATKQPDGAQAVKNGRAIVAFHGQAYDVGPASEATP